MNPVTEDTMRRALLLANWVKEHQTQCWSFFTPGNIKQTDPLERAIMQVVIDEAVKIERAGWKISNSELFSLVENKIGMSGVSKTMLGKAASKLGLTQCSIGKDRGRGLTPEKIHEFKITVGSVKTVGNPCATG